MNTAQRIVLVVGAILVAVAILYPPWYDEFPNPESWRGMPVNRWAFTSIFGFLLESQWRQQGFRVESGLLACELAGISLAVGFLVLALRSSR